MNARPRIFAMLGAAVAGALILALSAVTPASAAVAPPTMSKAHWMYFGWQGDQHKSLAYPGGELSPGGKAIVQYFVTAGSTTYYPNEAAADLRAQTQWTLADGYLPSPVASWPAGSTQVTIQHVAQSVLSGAATAVFTRVSITNTGAANVSETLNLNSPATAEIPISGTPTTSDSTSMTFALTIPAGGTVSTDFVALASGTATAAQLHAAGTFDANLASMTSYWNGRLAATAMPTALPDPQLADMYKAEQIVLWESIVNAPDGVEERGSGGNLTMASNYNRTFSHDDPDMVSQYIRSGDYATAKAILDSAYYQSFAVAPQNAPAEKYLDALAKNIIPYDLYEQYASDPGFFTADVRTRLQAAIHLMTSLEVTTAGDTHLGLMESSNDFDNGNDYLVTDDFSAMYALQAYANMATVWAADDAGWASEAAWAQNQAASIDTALNHYLSTVTIPAVGGFYNACLDRCGYSGNYTGNWFGTTLMMSSLPWDGALDGNTQLGTWSDTLDQSVYGAFSRRGATAPSIPPHSWGAWSNGPTGYGTTYNAGAGVQLLASSDPVLRTEGISDLEWLLANQSSPMNWGESFAVGAWSTPEADLESWGLSGSNKALLESNVSIRSDGTAIIGRGIPTEWLSSGQPISWSNVPAHDGRVIGFTIQQTGAKQIRLSLTGNTSTPVLFQLPVFAGNIAATSAGTADSTAGSVSIPAGTSSVTVTVTTETDPPIVTTTSTAAGYTFGDAGIQQQRAETFFAGTDPNVDDVKVTIRKDAGTAQSDVTVGLYAVSAGLPTGTALATAAIPASSVGAGFAVVTAPLHYSGLVDGQAYAIVLGQTTPGTSTYQWATSGSGGSFSFAKSNGTTWTKDSNLGDAALTVDVAGGQVTTLDIAHSTAAHYSFGQSTDQVTRSEEFLDTGITALTGVRVGIRKKAGGSDQNDATVTLRAVTNGVPSGPVLASASIDPASIGTSDTIVTVPLGPAAIVPGNDYAITLGQATPSSTSIYEWATSGSGGIHGFGKTTPTGAWADESTLGDAWLQVLGNLGTAPRPQSITFPAIAGHTLGDPVFTLNATADSGLPVTYAAAGTCKVDGDAVTVTGAGDCTVTANQDGNGGYLPASPVSRTFTIARATPAVSAPDVSTAWGTAGSVEVTVSSAVAEVSGTITLSEASTTRGSATLTDGKATVALPVGLAAGVHAFTAGYSGNDELAPATATVSITVVLPTAWSKTVAYQAGTIVSNDGQVYSALWYTKGETPGTSSTGAWQQIALTEDGTVAWTASRVFQAGDKAVYKGELYQAAWYSRGDTPGSVVGPWEQIATAPDGTALWTPTRIFQAGDVVSYSGQKYTAQWYTRDQTPGTSGGPWKASD